MSLTISSVVVVLVSTVFLVQNQYYTTQIERAAVHDNARVMTEVVASELRSTAPAGVTIAEADSMTVRSPIVFAVVCAVDGSFAYIQFEGGEEGLDQPDVGGLAVYDEGTGDWTYRNGTWLDIDGGTTDALANCAANGADTVGATEEFHRLQNLPAYYGSLPPAGSVVMLFRETTFRFGTSSMYPYLRALFRRSLVGSRVEVLSGLSDYAQFQYRTTGSTYVNSVSGAALADITAVRLVAEASRPPPTGGTDEITFGWSVNVPLGNAR